MNKYEIYIITKEGTLKPTGVWVRGHKLTHVEDNLSRAIKKIDTPCVIAISHLTQEDLESKV